MSQLELIFAEEVMMFVLDETLTSQRHKRNLRQLPSDLQFASSMRLFVRRYLERHEIEVLNIFNTLQGGGNNLAACFRAFAESMALQLMARGYDELEFVQFAAVICKLGVLCFLNNCRHCLFFAQKAILDAARYFRLSGLLLPNAWIEMCRTVHLKCSNTETI